MTSRCGGGRARRALALATAVALLSAAAATTAVTASAKSPRTSPARASASPPLPKIYTMHVHMNVSYRVVGTVTHIRGIQLSGLPPGWYTTIRCLGRHCFRPGLHHPWRKDLHILRKRRFYAGQRLVFIFNRPAFKTVTFVLRMRYNNDPRLSLYKPRRKHRSR